MYDTSKPELSGGDYVDGQAGYDKFVYTVAVKTTTAAVSGTNDRVEIQIIGLKNKTTWKRLKRDDKDIFEKGQTDVFSFSSVDVG